MKTENFKQQILSGKNSGNDNSPTKLVLSVFVLLGIIIFQSANAEESVPAIPVPYPIIDPGRVQERLSATQQQPFKPEKKINEQIIPVKKSESSLVAPAAEDMVRFKLSALIIEGVSVYKKKELLQYYHSYLGKDVSLSDLQNIASKITNHYRNDGYVLSKAIVPPQEIASGKTTIQVIEGFIANIYIEGSNSKIESQIKKYGEKIKGMRPLQIKNLERYILLLNDISGVTVKTVLSPSVSQVGAADLTLIVEQQRLQANAYYDNRSSKYLGPQEIIASGSISDVIMAADNLLLQTVDTTLSHEIRYLQLGYNFPLGATDWRVNINGSYTETKPGFVLKDLDLVGRSKNWGIKIEYPLLRTRNKNLWIYGKFDWLDSYTNFPTATLFKDHIRSLRFGAAYDFTDKLRGTNLISLEYSKGLNLFGASPLKPKTPLSRQNAPSDYKKLVLNASRYQSFGTRWMLVANANGQYSFNNPLLSAEEFSFGGGQVGRAYDSSEISGDLGVTGKLELRFNTFPELKFLQQIQYYTFYEIGAIWNIGNNFTQPNKDSGADLGGGLRATFNKYFYSNLELAKPLTKKVETQVTTGESGKDWRLFFGLGVKL